MPEHKFQAGDRSQQHRDGGEIQIRGQIAEADHCNQFRSGHCPSDQENEDDHPNNNLRGREFACRPSRDFNHPGAQGFPNRRIRRERHDREGQKEYFHHEEHYGRLMSEEII